jgi:hypothetical protein
MKRIGSAQEMEIIDLLARFQQWEIANPGTLYLKSDGHWSSVGHRLAAEIVAEKLVSSGAVSVR